MTTARGLLPARGLPAEIKWPLVRIGDFAALHYGKSLPQRFRRPGEIRTFGSNGQCGWHDTALAPGPTVLLGRKGQGPLGVEWCPWPFWVIDTAYYVTVDPARLDLRFFYYVTKFVGLNHLKDGTSNPSLSRDIFLQQAFPLPSLRVQLRIAGIVSTYDDLVENNLRRIQILEESTRALYREWFVHFRFPGHAKIGRMPSSLGAVPKGWEGHFRNLVELDRTGINPSAFPTEEFEHFSLPAFDDGRCPAIETGASILSAKHTIDASCVLLSKLNPRIPRVWLPEPSRKRRPITSTEFLVLRPRPTITRSFVYSKCISDDFAGKYGALAIGTSTSHQRVKPENLLAMPTVIADRSTIARFSLLADPMLQLAERLRTENRNLRTTRDLLLPRLLSGQISMNEAESAA